MEKSCAMRTMESYTAWSPCGWYFPRTSPTTLAHLRKGLLEASPSSCIENRIRLQSQYRGNIPTLSASDWSVVRIYPPVHGLEPVARVGECAADDDGHGVREVGLRRLRVELHIADAVRAVVDRARQGRRPAASVVVAPVPGERADL
eukprot:1179212-Prorocentrum_minimum.AAC.8